MQAPASGSNTSATSAASGTAPRTSASGPRSSGGHFSSRNPSPSPSPSPFDFRSEDEREEPRIRIVGKTPEISLTEKAKANVSDSLSEDENFCERGSMEMISEIKIVGKENKEEENLKSSDDIKVVGQLGLAAYGKKVYGRNSAPAGWWNAQKQDTLNLVNPRGSKTPEQGIGSTELRPPPGLEL